jgi:hypothetical protein
MRKRTSMKRPLCCEAKRFRVVHPDGYECTQCGAFLYVFRDRVTVLARRYAHRSGFAWPLIVARRRDPMVPGTSAFWVADQENPRGCLGVIVSKHMGVVTEFDAQEHPPRRFLPDGIAALL